MDILSIVLAVITSQAIGMFWYSKVGFGKKWMELSGINPNVNPEEGKKQMKKSMFICLILTFVTAGVISSMMNKYGLQIQCVMLLWLGLAFPVYASPALWENKSWKLVFLNTGYSFVATLAMAAIIYFL